MSSAHRKPNSLNKSNDDDNDDHDDDDDQDNDYQNDLDEDDSQDRVCDEDCDDLIVKYWVALHLKSQFSEWSFITDQSSPALSTSLSLS